MALLAQSPDAPLPGRFVKHRQSQSGRGVPRVGLGGTGVPPMLNAGLFSTGGAPVTPGHHSPRARPQAGRPRHIPAPPKRGVVLRLLLAAWLGLFLCAGASGQAPKEYQIKAVFLFNFIQFVEWPAAVFPTPETPIRIGVFGDDPFGGALETAVEGERVRGRPVVIIRAERLHDLLSCHAIFVCPSERAQVGPILNVLNGRPILTVGDSPDFARRGGVISFYLEGQKVRFEINRAAAGANGLKLSSQLLSLARLVGPPAGAEER